MFSWSFVFLHIHLYLLLFSFSHSIPLSHRLLIIKHQTLIKMIASNFFSSKKILMLFILFFYIQLGLIYGMEQELVSNSTLSHLKHAHLPMKPGYIVLLIIVVLVGPWCLWITCFMFRASSEGYESRIQSLLQKRIHTENVMKEASDTLNKAQ